MLGSQIWGRLKAEEEASRPLVLHDIGMRKSWPVIDRAQRDRIFC